MKKTVLLLGKPLLEFSRPRVVPISISTTSMQQSQMVKMNCVPQICDTEQRGGCITLSNYISK
jgi:hypothetical protein